MQNRNHIVAREGKIALCAITVLLLVSCAAGVTATPASPTPATTHTPIPSATLLPSPTQTATPSPVPISAICSPLGLHPLEELPLIVSWPFNPAVGHYGLDLAHWQWEEETSSLNEPVQAIMDGKIAGIVIDRPPSGNMITIETTYIQLPSVLIERLEILPGQSIYHQYAHLADSPDFQLGQSIGCGQFLDRVGLTGWTGAEHLHLETRQGPAGFSFTSMAFYTADATPKEMANYQTWFYNGGYQVFDPMILLAIEQP